MKILCIKLLVALGFISFFKGTTGYFEANAKENSSGSQAGACDTMGGKSDGCGKSL